MYPDQARKIWNLCSESRFFITIHPLDAALAEIIDKNLTDFSNVFEDPVNFHNVNKYQIKTLIKYLFQRSANLHYLRKYGFKYANVAMLKAYHKIYPITAISEPEIDELLSYSVASINVFKCIRFLAQIEVPHLLEYFLRSETPYLIYHWLLLHEVQISKEVLQNAEGLTNNIAQLHAVGITDYDGSIDKYLWYFTLLSKLK